MRMFGLALNLHAYKYNILCLFQNVSHFNLTFKVSQYIPKLWYCRRSHCVNESATNHFYLHFYSISTSKWRHILLCDPQLCLGVPRPFWKILRLIDSLVSTPNTSGFPFGAHFFCWFCFLLFLDTVVSISIPCRWEQAAMDRNHLSVWKSFPWDELPLNIRNDLRTEFFKTEDVCIYGLATSKSATLLTFNHRYIDVPHNKYLLSLDSWPWVLSLWLMAHFMPTTTVYLTINQRLGSLGNGEILRFGEHGYHARILPQFWVLTDNMISLKGEAHLVRPFDALSGEDGGPGGRRAYIRRGGHQGSSAVLPADRMSNWVFPKCSLELVSEVPW